MRDMYGFIVILIFLFVGFSLIFTEFDHTVVYGAQLYATYGVLYGNVTDINFNVSQKLFAAVIIFLLNVVLLNLLISIMGDSFDKVQERRVLTDSLTRLELIFEVMTYKRIISKKRELKRAYLMQCARDEAEEDEYNNKNEWEGRINLIKKKLAENREEVRKEIGALEDKIDRNHKEVLRVIEKLFKSQKSNDHEKM